VRTVNYLINVYSITFVGLHYWLVHSFFVFECIIECMLLFVIRTRDDNSHAI